MLRSRAANFIAETADEKGGAREQRAIWERLASSDMLGIMEILLAPMIVAGLLGRVDVKAKSSGSGGITALPRAVRHGTALGIAALYPEKMEPLRLVRSQKLCL
ncbi:hypothetical protein TELCIR_10704 [Teladorsagia circumcincta]|uniref:Uncharacterized protein n=1 Tax=Teladorsagia circumcincta TaxID=45464 RepID=A0A2G9UBD3_TELCI|nr:hypothetical protein TELCIR_10704 [Teladorsagia circumcincta]